MNLKRLILQLFWTKVEKLTEYFLIAVSRDGFNEFITTIKFSKTKTIHCSSTFVWIPVLCLFSMNFRMLWPIFSCKYYKPNKNSVIPQNLRITWHFCGEATIKKKLLNCRQWHPMNTNPNPLTKRKHRSELIKLKGPFCTINSLIFFFVWKISQMWISQKSFSFFIETTKIKTCFHTHITCISFIHSIEWNRCEINFSLGFNFHICCLRNMIDLFFELKLSIFLCVEKSFSIFCACSNNINQLSCDSSYRLFERKCYLQKKNYCPFIKPFETE